MTKCIKHPKVEAVTPTMIKLDGKPLNLCRDDVKTIRDLINYKYPETFPKTETDEIKLMHEVERQKTLNYTIDIISKSVNGKLFLRWLK